MKDRIRRIKSIFKHKVEFRKLTKRSALNRELFIRSITHDLDKLLMLMFLPIPTNIIRRIHKKIARHHNRKTMLDIYESVVDFECARFSKANSKMTGKEWINYIYNNNEITKEEYDIMIYVLREYIAL